ncbi:serine hydrolase domain-containing protein [Zhihengliuella sp. ISTPL4]|uniref:serine hydrolase domain-containing protein n=1 Tax=Zhihengliuella sp. ISTPL4 TaxID=2058657 RepID=UPI000C7CD17E|nr:serine hydrolase [Zhihengliuella sp. ISTPL4]
MSPRPLLPRAAPRSTGLSSAAVGAMIDAIDAAGIEGHSVMVVHRGAVVAEGSWTPYSADRPQLLYSVTKSVTAMAVGLAIDDGLLALDDRVVDLLPERAPREASRQAGRLTVRHLLAMTAGHGTDTLADAWDREPRDLVRGFLSVPFAAPEGTQHTYDNATTFVLARIVERVTGRDLAEYLDDRLFGPMGIDDAEWDRVGGGAVFGFHGLHLRIEALAAIGELLRQSGAWRGRQLLPRRWVELMTTKHIDSRHYGEDEHGADFLSGYGFQIWLARDGFHANGAFGQHCIVFPRDELVIALTSAQYTIGQAQEVIDAARNLLVGLGHPDPAADDQALAARLQSLALAPVVGNAGAVTAVSAVVHCPPEASAVPPGTRVALEPCGDGWHLRLSGVGTVLVGRSHWAESSPRGRAVCASGGWSGGVFVAQLFLVDTPHHLTLSLDPGTGRADLIWDTVPLTTPELRRHLTSPLMTRPDHG